jgi:hypothetical protein
MKTFTEIEPVNLETFEAAMTDFWALAASNKCTFTAEQYDWLRATLPRVRDFIVARQDYRVMDSDRFAQAGDADARLRQQIKQTKSGDWTVTVPREWGIKS